MFSFLLNTNFDKNYSIFEFGFLSSYFQRVRARTITNMCNNVCTNMYMYQRMLPTHGSKHCPVMFLDISLQFSNFLTFATKVSIDKFSIKLFLQIIFTFHTLFEQKDVKQVNMFIESL